jgi:methionyl-tRNA synthetase
MSKSLGNVIDPLELIDVYGADAVRYYAARVTNFGQDGNVSVDDVRERYERELGNDLGNLVSRTTAMIAATATACSSRRSATAVGRGRLRERSSRARPLRDHRRARGDLAAVRRLNQYVEESASWQLAKDDSRAGELTTVLYNLADGLTRSPWRSRRTCPESAPRNPRGPGSARRRSLARAHPSRERRAPPRHRAG